MGEYAHSVDAKGRVIFPADFRAEVGETFIATKGLDNCLSSTVMKSGNCFPVS